MPEKPCPSREQLVQLVVGTLLESDFRRVAEHVDQCPECEATIVRLESSSDTLLSQLRKQAPEDQYSGEADCARAVAAIEAIGREPSFTLAMDGQPPADDVVELGTIRDYKLLAKLGQGGMGTVYKALHMQLEKVVALKVLPADRIQDQEAIERFHREMKAVGKLAHPNIVAAHDAGEFEGTHFLVMELIAGIDLSNLVRRLGTLGVANACELVRQAAVGLSHAHGHGMVHRDIKPSNLMLSRAAEGAPQVKILDMGLALLDDNKTSGARELTTTGQMMGTLDYMAPEQGTGAHEVDPRADIYSLGATLFKLLCGEAPFSGPKYNTPVKMMMALATGQAPSIATKREGLPPELVGIVDRMLARNPDDRFATSQEVAEALAPLTASADLAGLLTGVPADAEDTVDQSAIRTQEHLASGSHETAPTIDLVTQEDDAKENADLDLIDATEVYPEPGPNTVASAAQSAPAGWWNNRRFRITAVAAGLCGIALLGIITLLLPTKDGTLIVEIDDPEGLVQVTVEGKDVVITEKDKAGEPITLRAGDHKLLVKRGELEFATKEFKLRRDEKAILSVRVVAGEVRVLQNGRVIGRGVPSAVPVAIGPTGLALDPAADRGQGGIRFDVGRGNVVLPLKLTPNEPLTVEIWVTSEAVHEHGTSRRVWHAGGMELKQHSGRWAACINTPNVSERRKAIAGPGVVPDERTHIAATFAEDSFAFFVNGRLIERRDIPGLPPTAKSMFLGSVEYAPKAPKYEPFEGVLHEVRLSRTARYQDDFTPESRFESDSQTLALYRIDAGTGDTLKDSSGNGHDGRLVRAKWVRQSGDLDRIAAEWVLSCGGSVIVRVDEEKQAVDVATNLPSKSFSLLAATIVGSPSVTDKDLKRFQGLRQLSELELAGIGCSNAGLANLKGIPNLSRLTLKNTGISDAAMKHIHELPMLKTLVLNEKNLTDAAMQPMPNCTVLVLYCGKITSASVVHLKECTQLRLLYIQPTQITADGVDELHTSLPNCKIVSEHTGDPDRHTAEWVLQAGGKVTFKDAYSSEHETTDLDKIPATSYFWVTGISLRGMEHVSHSDLSRLHWLSDLTYLDARSTDLSDEAIPYLTRLRALSFVDLRDTNVTAEAVGALKKAFPDCQILWGPADEDPAPMAQWPLGPKEDVLRGIVPRPAEISGIRRWQIETVAPRSRINAVAWSPDGRLIAYATNTGLVRLYDADTLKLVRLLIGHERGVFSLDWSPDGKQLASASEDATVRIWQLDGSSQVLEGHKYAVASVAWSPDGKWIASAGGSDGEPVIRLWSADGVPGPVLEGHKAGLSSVCWDSSSNWLASVSKDKTVRLWKPDGAVGPVLEHQDPIVFAKWNPDGQQLATVTKESAKAQLWMIDGKPGPVLENDTLLTSLAWSPDGKMLATGGKKMIRLWGRDGGQLHEITNAHNHEVLFLGWSPNGQYLASTSRYDTRVRIWDHEGKETAEISAGENPEAVAWSPDNQHIVLAAGRQDKTMQVWHVDGTLQTELPAHTVGVHDATWSPDGRRLATSNGDATVRLYTSEGTPKEVFKGDWAKLWVIAWSPDGKWIAAGEEGYNKPAIRLWTVDGQPGLVLKGHTSCIGGLAWSPDSKWLASSSWDGTAKLWKTDGTTGPILEGHEGHVTQVVWSPDGRLLATSGRDCRTVRIWGIDGTHQRTFEGHLSAVNAVAWHPDGDQLASVGSDWDLLVWDSNGGLLRKSRTDGWRMLAVGWSTDGKRLAVGGEDERVTIYSQDGVARATLPHSLAVNRIAWHPDGRRIAVVGHDNIFLLWDAETAAPIWVSVRLRDERSVTFSGAGQLLVGDPQTVEQEFVYVVENLDGNLDLLSRSEFQKLTQGEGSGLVQKFEGHTQNIRGVAFLPDGKHVLSGGDDKTVRLWDVSTGKVVRQWGERSIAGMAVSADGKRAITGSLSSRISLWDVQSGNEVLFVYPPSFCVRALAFAPDARTFLTGGNDGEVILWNAETGEKLKEFAGHTTTVSAVAFLPDGDSFVAGDYDGQVIQWDVQSGEEIRRVKHDRGGVRAVTPLMDGKQLVSTSNYGEIKLWDVGTGKLLREFKGYRFSVTSAAVVPGGKYLVTGGDDRAIRVWDIETAKELHKIQADTYCTRHLDISPDGRYVISGAGYHVTGKSKPGPEGDFALRLWQLPELK